MANLEQNKGTHVKGGAKHRLSKTLDKVTVLLLGFLFVTLKMMALDQKKIGRPLIYTDPNEMYAAGEAYIRTRTLGRRPPTVTGLALALGLSGRKVLDDYERREEFSYSIKRLKSKCEDYYEECLTNGQPAAGAIFALKNFGWRDKTEVEHSGDVNLSLAAQIESARRRVMESHEDES